jgi:DNA-binding response OmpR family regulator
MANIIYFGGAPLNQPLVRLLRNAGHKLLAFNACGISKLHDSRCQAVLVDWNSPCDQAMVRAAKQEAIPVVVVSSHVSEAFWADKVLADIYLEKPVEVAEIASALLKAIDECQNGTIGPNHGVVSVTN